MMFKQVSCIRGNDLASCARLALKSLPVWNVWMSLRENDCFVSWGKKQVIFPVVAWRKKWDIELFRSSYFVRLSCWIKYTSRFDIEQRNSSLQMGNASANFSHVHLQPSQQSNNELSFYSLSLVRWIPLSFSSAPRGSILSHSDKDWVSGSEWNWDPSLQRIFFPSTRKSSNGTGT